MSVRPEQTLCTRVQLGLTAGLSRRRLQKEYPSPQARYAHSPAVHAGLVRAHAGADDADAERRAGVAGRQRRSRITAWRSPIWSSCSDRVRRHGRAADARRIDPDVVGLSVMTFQRAHGAAAHPSDPRASSPAVRVVVGGYDPSLAPEAYERARRRRRLPRARRRRSHVPRAAARARARRRRSAADSPASSVLDGRRVPRTTPARARQPPRRRRDRAAEPRRARARRLHLPRPADRHRRDVARLHLRLQLLLDHRDARPQLPHRSTSTRVLADIADARDRGARAIFIVDDNITLNVARFEALCRAIVDAGLNDIALHRPGDDLVDRQPRRRRSRR